VCTIYIYIYTTEAYSKHAVHSMLFRLSLTLQVVQEIVLVQVLHGVLVALASSTATAVLPACNVLKAVQRYS
jgi:hypothetical protein